MRSGGNSVIEEVNDVLNDVGGSEGPENNDQNAHVDDPTVGTFNALRSRES